MARADVLKNLLRSYQRRDDLTFRKVVAQIIEEERRKHHPVLANELEQIINNGSENVARQNGFTLHDRPPQDTDKGVPLLEVRQPDRYFGDLVLDTTISKLVDRLVYEFRSWEILEANGLSPTRRVLFCGPSGCGKTVTAEAISSELGLTYALCPV
jgi:SpoVK/Ycf46/Vps4 family AAA+-type ATPase